jgi:tetratricopeptide (TPR) repeat protein
MSWASVSPDGSWVAFGLLADRVNVYEAATGRRVWQSPADGLDYCRFSSDGCWLLTDNDGSRAYAVGTWEPGPRLGPGRPWDVTSDGLVVLGLTDGIYRLVELATGREVARLEDPEHNRGAAVFTPDGTRLVVGAKDGLRVWDLRRIRVELAKLDLDWDWPPYSPVGPKKGTPPLTLSVDYGSWMVLTNPGQAVGVYSLAIALCPLNPEAYLQRGRAYVLLKEPQKTIADYSLFLALTPPEDKRRAEVLFRRSNNYRVLNQHAESLADVLQLVQLNLDNLGDLREHVAQRCHELARSLVIGPEKERDPAKALPLAEKAEALSPEQWHYLNTLGVVYYRFGRYEEATATLERSARHSHDHAADLFFLAMCHARRGDPAKAKDCCGRAVQWVQDRHGKLAKEDVEELNAFRAEAEILLKKGARPYSSRTKPPGLSGPRIVAAASAPGGPVARSPHWIAATSKQVKS